MRSPSQDAQQQNKNATGNHSDTHPHRKNRRPKILYFTRILPQPGTNGSGAYAADILDYLQRHGCEVRVVWTQTPDRLKYTFYNTLSDDATRAFDIRPHNCYRVGHHVFNWRALWLPRKARFLYYVKRLLQGAHLFPARHNACKTQISKLKSEILPPRWDTPCTATERAFLYEHAAAFKPDILIANYPWMLADVEKKHTAPVHWVQTNDYRFRRCTLTPAGRFTETYIDPQGRETEQHWLANSDLLIAIQTNEAAAYARAHPGKKIITACMTTPRIPINRAPPTPIIAFIGSGHIINQKSALWFVEKVWPHVLRHISHARLRVAGKVCDCLAPLNRAKRPRVELLGQIPDIHTFYAGASIAVVPILEGSGVKIKLLEAISHQRAAVTTSVGLDGLEFLRPGLAVADTPETIAASIVQLLTDTPHRDRQAAAALELAQTHLTPEACYAPLLKAATHRA